MSKKTSKLNPQRRGVAAKKNVQTRGREKLSSAPARSYKRPQRAAGLNARAVRLAALVIAVLALAAGTAWAFAAQGSTSTGLIIGLTALGFLAGLALLTAIRPERVIKLVNRWVKR